MHGLLDADENAVQDRRGLRLEETSYERSRFALL
jgi:hypothetical protein